MTLYNGDYKWHPVDDADVQDVAQRSLEGNVELEQLPDGRWVTASKGEVWERGKKYRNFFGTLSLKHKLRRKGIT